MGTREQIVQTSLKHLHDSLPRPESAHIDATFGPTQSYLYWSSATYALFPTSAGAVSFDPGSAIFAGKTYSYFVRAVRGGL
jgi:hypothetical protein